MARSPVGCEGRSTSCVSFREVVQQATVSFAALRGSARQPARRRPGAAWGPWAGGPTWRLRRSFSLRSGAEHGRLGLPGPGSARPGSASSNRRLDAATASSDFASRRKKPGCRAASNGPAHRGPGTGREPGPRPLRDLAVQLICDHAEPAHGTFPLGSAATRGPPAARSLLSARPSLGPVVLRAVASVANTQVQVPFPTGRS